MKKTITNWEAIYNENFKKVFAEGYATVEASAKTERVGVTD